MLPILVERYYPFTSASLLKLSMAKNIQHHYLLNDSSRYALIHIKRYFTTNEEETLNLLRHWLIEHEVSNCHNLFIRRIT